MLRRLKVVLLLIFVFCALYFSRFFFTQETPILAEPQTIAAEVAKSFSGTVSVLQNFTTDKLTILTVVRSGQQALKYEIYDGNNVVLENSFVLKTSNINDKYQVDQLDISLQSNLQDYFLKVFEADKLIDVRQFRLLNLNESEPRIAVTSCARVGWLGHDFGPVSIWDELLLQKPDVLLFLGDMVYPDTAFQALLSIKPTDAEIQHRFVEAWQEIRLYHQYHLTPVFTAMDDHDYGFQGANARNNSENSSQRVNFFRMFYPMPTEKIDGFFEPGPGAAFYMKLYGFKIFMLDNKINRIAQSTEGVDGPIWGEQQLTWMGNILEKDESPALIASGTLFTFPEYNQDAAMYEAPEEFQRFVAQAKRNKGDFVLMSGDVHYSAVHKLSSEVFGHESYEIVASRIHSISPSIIPPFINGYVGKEKGQLAHTSEKNFVLIRTHNGNLKSSQVDIYEKDRQEPYKSIIFK